jgi:hypothetical protein
VRRFPPSVKNREETLTLSTVWWKGKGTVFQREATKDKSRKGSNEGWGEKRDRCKLAGLFQGIEGATAALQASALTKESEGAVKANEGGRV